MTLYVLSFDAAAQSEVLIKLAFPRILFWTIPWRERTVVMLGSASYLMPVVWGGKLRKVS